jgi:hypothetical protein
MRALGEQYLGRSPVFNPQCSVVPSLLPDLAMAKERRKNAVYLQHVFALVHCVGHNARNIVDDGSHGCPLSRVVRLDSDEGLNRHPQALPVPPTVEGIVCCEGVRTEAAGFFAPRADLRSLSLGSGQPRPARA